MSAEIARGAESVLYKKNGELVKHRIKKSYRIPEIDVKLRRSRTKKEAKLLKKAGRIINAPKVLKADHDTMKINMEFIHGRVLRDVIENLKPKALMKTCRTMGESVARIHDEGIIHGDLTTSNMIINDEKVFFIDFGLGEESDKTESKAVDLHVLKEALESRHHNIWEKAWDEIIGAYKKKSKKSKHVLERLKAVEKRGRYLGKSLKKP